MSFNSKERTKGMKMDMQGRCATLRLDWWRHGRTALYHALKLTQTDQTWSRRFSTVLKLECYCDKARVSLLMLWVYHIDDCQKSSAAQCFPSYHRLVHVLCIRRPKAFVQTMMVPRSTILRRLRLEWKMSYWSSQFLWSRQDRVRLTQSWHLLRQIFFKMPWNDIIPMSVQVHCNRRGALMQRMDILAFWIDESICLR